MISHDANVIWRDGGTDMAYNVRVTITKTIYDYGSGRDYTKWGTYFY